MTDLTLEVLDGAEKWRRMRIWLDARLEEVEKRVDDVLRKHEVKREAEEVSHG